MWTDNGTHYSSTAFGLRLSRGQLGWVADINCCEGNIILGEISQEEAKDRAWGWAVDRVRDRYPAMRAAAVGLGVLYGEGN